MRGDGDSTHFLQHGGQFDGETISAGLELNGVWTVAPRNLVVWFPMKCMGWSLRCSFRSYVFAVDARRARLWHFGLWPSFYSILAIFLCPSATSYSSQVHH